MDEEISPALQEGIPVEIKSNQHGSMVYRVLRNVRREECAICFFVTKKATTVGEMFVEKEKKSEVWHFFSLRNAGNDDRK